MKFIRFTTLINALRECNPRYLLCYGSAIDSKVHLKTKGSAHPICDFPGSTREVYYLNGAQTPEKYCPECFEDHEELLKELTEEK